MEAKLAQRSTAGPTELTWRGYPPVNPRVGYKEGMSTCHPPVGCEGMSTCPPTVGLADILRFSLGFLVLCWEVATLVLIITEGALADLCQELR